ncbi:MAG: rubredoxin, partial [Okeania sp. SIO2G4]|nr:rubredoxin [Okeania sp. SIO2G4]
MSEQVTEATEEQDRYECRACGYVYEPKKGILPVELPFF